MTDTTIALDPKGEARSEQARRAAQARWNRAPAEPAGIPLGPIVARPADDGIRELHGVVAQPNNGSVRATENEATITIRVWTGNSGTERNLSPDQARAFADQIYQLAARVDRRKGQRP